MILGVRNDFFLLAFADNDTGVSPIGVIHVPERVERQSETENGETAQTNGKNRAGSAYSSKGKVRQARHIRSTHAKM